MRKALFGFCLLLSVSFQAAQWKLAKNSDGIKVYTREFPNSDIKEFKAVTIVKTPIKNIEKLLDNTEELPEWMENVITAKTLKEINPQEKYVYFAIEFPWPFSDRDMVMKETKTLKSDGSILYATRSAYDYAPEKEDFVRMKIAQGRWEIFPVSATETKVVYQFYGDPAGSIPNWLVNMFIVDGPYKTLKNIKKKFE